MKYFDEAKYEDLMADEEIERDQYQLELKEFVNSL